MNWTPGSSITGNVDLGGFVDGFTGDLVLFLLGIFLGGGAGSVVTWRVMVNKSSHRVSQKAGKQSNQTYVGGNSNVDKSRRRDG